MRSESDIRNFSLGQRKKLISYENSTYVFFLAETATYKVTEFNSKG